MDREAMERVFSDARMRRYFDTYNDETAAMRLYTWNIQISSAFWGPICILEVALRNALHAQMTARCRREDWWNEDRLPLLQRERRAVDEAIGALADRDERAGREPAEPSPGDVVGASNFGLWVGLLSEGKPRDRVYSYETALWQPRLRHAFPHRGEVGRKQIYAVLNDVRYFRNRIAHHEPVFNAPHAKLLTEVTEIVGYIDPTVADYITAHERVTAVLEAKKAVIIDGQVGF